MPEISRFFGIVIRMFAEPDGPHYLPHFHAYYCEAEAIFRIDPIERIEGSLPRRQMRLVKAWAEIHHMEVRANWARLARREAPVPIDPLS